MPASKSTSTAEVYLTVHQFDFQPLLIRIIGSGTQSVARPLPKRVKSSKLAPLKEGEEGKKTPQSMLRRRPSGEMSGLISNQMSAIGTLNPGQLGTATLRKTQIRTSYPKLMSAKRTLVEEDETKDLDPAKIAEREYLNRFGIVHDLDKEKDIKFAQYLGDKAMDNNDIEFEQQLTAEIERIRLQALEKRTTGQINPELSSEMAVEFKTVPDKIATWDDKQNDEHHNRREALARFMKAGTKVILHYRLMKRLSKIQEMLSTCKNKEEVSKLVEEGHAKAVDREQGLTIAVDYELFFEADNLRPSYFELDFEEEETKKSSVVYKPEGRTSFDDLAAVKEIVPHNMEILKFTESNYPADYYNHNSAIPPPRQSAEEEYYLKSAALGEAVPDTLSSVYSLPLKVPAHHFIYDQQLTKRYQPYAICDEKDPELYLQNDEPIEDEFEGWTEGEYEILKFKFSRNMGCPYTTSSGFNFSC